VRKRGTHAHEFAEFFRWYAILPTPLHEALQKAAKQEGWTPPWDREEEVAAEQFKKNSRRKKRPSARWSCQLTPSFCQGSLWATETGSSNTAIFGTFDGSTTGQIP
jgi:hypothetical protein